MVNDEDCYSDDLSIPMNQTIKKVTDDYEVLKFNTAIAQLMTLSNEFRQKGSITKKEWETYLILLNPVAPHITEELWETAGFSGHIATDVQWPDYDESKLVGDTIEMPVQVNGKVRGQLRISPNATKEEVLAEVEKTEAIQRQIRDKNILKVIFVPGKILNIVCR